MLGIGVPKELPDFQSAITGSKLLALKCFLYHWKVIEA
jgi:hypothetical protein